MPHRKFDPGAIRRAEDAVAYYDGLIARVRAIKQAGLSPEVKALVENVKELEFDAGVRKDFYLSRQQPSDSTLAYGAQQAQKAYQEIITMFEAPDQTIASYEDQKKQNMEYIERVKSGQSTRGY